MSYQAFALKYRPHTFDEVVGQEHVVASLRTAITKKRVHHAYLFSGPRGVGKTSLARILAQALNCEKGPTVTPCGKCTSCSEIARATSLDIIEIDGASNRGIDEIRTLRESIKLSPANSRFKVYIIDEVHMLTQEAFNALLKTLEEPPAHVKFIFATTHPQKVLPTILSRCQKFQFTLLPIEKIIQKLQHIVKEEKVTVPESLLYAVGRAGGGSIRDAESLLDQLVPVILQKGTVKDILSFLGIIDEETLNQALKGLVAKELEASLYFIHTLVTEGKDLGVFLTSLIEHVRSLLLAKVSAKSFTEFLELSPQSKELLSELAKAISTGEVLTLIDLLIKAKELSSKLNTVRVPLELAFIKFSYDEANDASSPVRLREVSAVPQKEQAAADDVDAFDLDDDEPAVDDSLDFDEEEGGENAPDDILMGTLRTQWKACLLQLQKTRAALASHLQSGQPVSSTGNTVKIGFTKKDAFHQEMLGNAKKIQFLEEHISKFLGQPVIIKFVTVEQVQTPVADTVVEPQPSVAVDENGEEGAQPGTEEHNNEFLNELLDTFGGNLYSEEDH